MDHRPLPPELEERFRRDVRDCGLEELWPRLRPLALPSWQAGPVPAAERLRIWASRLGGLPDLPPGLTWPFRDGGLLTFIAQINLAPARRRRSRRRCSRRSAGGPTRRS